MKTLVHELILTFILTLLAVNLIHAQNEIERNDEYLIEHFELPDGPSGNSINCITQGPNGFLWFGGHSGLYRYDGYHIKSYKSDSADSTSLIFAYIEWLFWSSDNYLWIGTYGGGLFRFDADDESFIRYQYDPNDPTSLSNNRITSIIEENEDILWVGTTDGLNRFDRRTEKFERFYSEDNDPSSLSSNDVRSLYIDRDGTIWIGTGFIFNEDKMSGGLNRFHPETNNFTRYLHEPGNPTSLMGNIIKVIYEDSQGNFWVGGTGGLHKMDRASGTFERMLKDENSPNIIFAPGIRKGENGGAYSMIEDTDQNLWIFSLHSPPSNTLGSIAKFDLRTNQMEILRERVDVVPWQTTRTNDGSIWIAGAGVGAKVHRIRPGNSQIKYLPFLSGDRGIVFEGLASEGDSVLWGKTMAEDGTIQLIGMSANNWSRWGIRDLPQINFDNINTSGLTQFFEIPGLGLVRQDNGRIWGCTGFRNGGVFRVHPGTAEAYQYRHNPNDPNTPMEDDVRFMISDREGHIWMANQNSISRLDPVNLSFTHYRHSNEDPNSLSDSEFITLFEDLEGYIWAGGQTFDQGPSLNRLDPRTDEVKKISLGSIFQGNTLTCITQNPAGDIISLVDGQGLFIFFREAIRAELWEGNFPVERLLSNLFQNANNLIADDEGILWLTDTDGRIYRLDSELESVVVFYEQPGLEFKSRHAFKMADGTIYFVHQNGMVAVNPLGKTSSQVVQHVNLVHFTEFFLNGQSVGKGDESILENAIWTQQRINLSHHQNNFGLRFSAFDFKNPDNSQYEVRLLPVETEWRRIEGDPIVNYYQLSPKNYTLEVKGSDSNGIWYEEVARIEIHIAPPWWRSWLAYSCYGLLFLFSIYSIYHYQRQRIIQKERQRTLEREVLHAKEIEKAYSELKSTQSQLIQSEKMASLGELTAGIAHEIQNPLNFVNNFSDVNTELITELVEEIKDGNIDDAIELANDIKANEEKIKHHGGRADSIVKGMLEHSRTNTGEKVPTDINALCDEYLRLSYHGLRAKDHTFNADFKTHFDPELPKINAIPQDFGRVLLNLINNAFQACAERSVVSSTTLSHQSSTTLSHQSSTQEDYPSGVGGAGGKDLDATQCSPSIPKGSPPSVSEGENSLSSKNEYQPKVDLTTEQLNNSTILITISDNGLGIPDSIKEKIFQPFFTTKPTGQGTGLGLSLSYDIVKAHGGELKVESEEGKGTEFKVILPIV